MKPDFPLLVPLLLLAACGGGPEAAEDSAPARAAAAPPAPAEAAAPDQDPAVGRNAAPPVIGREAGRPPASVWQPTREPEFHFEPGGPIPDEKLADYHVELSCSVDGKDVGTMVIGLWPEKAPVTVRRFLRLCDEGFYDGTTFHRIIRNFMVQGGDPTGTGAGDGPYGHLPGEFSDEPQYEHHYGVLSMARGNDPDSAGCQFFIVCAESASVWNLDGRYASFGKLVAGVDTLEALANAPTDPRSREGSRPTVPVRIERARVVAGPAPPPQEKIERPAPDLGGEPAMIEVQHVLVSFRDTRVKADRSKEEAFELARIVLEKARAGEDFSALVREYSDDPIDPRDPLPGLYRMTNRGVTDPVFERAIFEAEKKYQARDQELTAKVGKGEISYQEKQQQMQALKQELLGQLPPQSFPRQQMAKAFGDVAFSLGVGEIGMAEYSPVESPFGWHIIKRIK
ncbi:MAG: hypothetical protein D6702_11655 [Planctomycetota bacterium]|nr:MAG: hypothetical protein D6702_11655 [Planctomycetota bacterium]